MFAVRTGGGPAVFAVHMCPAGRRERGIRASHIRTTSTVCRGQLKLIMKIGLLPWVPGVVAVQIALIQDPSSDVAP
jgi:hypothetical protein